MTLAEIKNQVEILISTGEYSKAYKLAQEVLRADPDNRTFQQLSHRISDLVTKQNRQIIRKELKKLEPLLQQKKFKQYLQQAAHLQSYINEYPEIAKKLIEAKQLMEQQLKHSKDQYIENQIQQIKEKFNQNKQQEAINEISNLIKFTRNDSQLTRLAKELRMKWTNQLLSKNQSLLSSPNTEKIILFLLKLKKISADNSQVQKLLKKFKQRQLKEIANDKKDTIFKIIEESSNHIHKGKYSLAIRKLEGILHFDPKNKQITSLISKAKSKLINVMNCKIVRQINYNASYFQKDYSTNPSNYIHI